jgi:hypothetical protein
MYISSFYKEHFMMKEETLLCLLSHKSCPSLYSPDEQCKKALNCVCEKELEIITRGKNAPMESTTPQIFFSVSVVVIGHFRVGTGEGVYV